MMPELNWWLMALAFLLGLALTFAMMIRRVTREVPVIGAIPSSAVSSGEASAAADTSMVIVESVSAQGDSTRRTASDTEEPRRS
jgi:uncharacterized membrane protein ArfC